MAVVKPFRGTFYSPGLDPSRVLAPPYDVISPEQRRDLLARDSHNVVRLILPGTNEAAARDFRAWRAGGIFVTDPAPGFYWCRQEYTLDGRSAVKTGLIGILKTEPLGRGSVRPHEETIPQVKEEQFRLLGLVRANFCPIITVYRDSRRFVEKLAAGIQPAPADFSYRDDTGTFFQLWRLPADPRLEAFFRGRRLYIADGHHRYQCNLRYGRAQRRPAAAYILTCFLNAAEVESQVNSFHRYLAAAGPDLLRRLAGRFHLQPAAGAPELLAGLKPGWLGFGFAGRFYRFRIPARPGPEVVYLHKKILAGLLDRSDESVAYEPDGLALAAGLDKPAGAAFFLPPVSIGRLHRIWEAGRILPRKSTYFYPKVPSGLIVYRNDLEHFNRG